EVEPIPSEVRPTRISAERIRMAELSARIPGATALEPAQPKFRLPALTNLGPQLWGEELHDSLAARRPAPLLRLLRITSDIQDYGLGGPSNPRQANGHPTDPGDAGMGAG